MSITVNFKIADRIQILRVDDTAKITKALAERGCNFQIHKRGGTLRESKVDVRAVCPSSNDSDTVLALLSIVNKCRADPESVACEVVHAMTDGL